MITPVWDSTSPSSTCVSRSGRTGQSSTSRWGLRSPSSSLKGQKTAKPETLKKPEQKQGAADTTASELYLARDESRPELFFVDKEFIDKLRKGPADLRDKALASFQRWDIDSITLTNAKGAFNLAKTEGGGDWVLGDGKKKAKWDVVNGILDALEKPVKEFIDSPAAPATYGLDKPAVRVVLKQKGQVKLECDFGKEAKDGVYAQVKGETSVKVADKESLEKLGKGESDLRRASARSAGSDCASRFQEVVGQRTQRGREARVLLFAILAPVRYTFRVLALKKGGRSAHLLFLGVLNDP